MEWSKRFAEKLVWQFLFLVTVIFLLSLCAFLFTSRYTAKLRRQNILELSQERISSTQIRLDGFFDNLENVAASFSYSPTTERYLMQDSLHRVQDAASLSSVFANTLLLENDIKSIYLYGADMERIASLGKEFMVQEIVRQPNATAEVGCGFIPDHANHLYYPFYYPIYDLAAPAYHHLLGMCIFILSPDSLDDLLTDIVLTQHSEVYLIDQKSRILSSNVSTQRAILNKDLQQDSRDYQVQTVMSAASGWKIVCRVPESDLVRRKPEIDLVLLLLYGISIFLLLLLVCFFYFHILRPIHTIDRFVRRNIETPEERLHLKRKDEIGKVAASLDQMLDQHREMSLRMQQSQKNMYEKEIAMKQAQVIAYRNQVNPHFLYNTLECIRDMALYYEADSIAEITMALSCLFRYAVKESNVVTVEEEVENIQEYAKIIAYRFMGKISVDVSLDPTIRKKPMMKLLLQPLVENAVFHGLEQKVEEGFVDITIIPKDGDKICFIIEDDGCGMSQEELQKLTDEMQSQENKDRIGIANICRRLKLLYENNFSFTVESEIGVGTCFTIIIPDFITEEEKHD